MRTWILPTLLCCLPNIGSTEPAIVRSGEHDGFSRIVAPLVNNQKWSVTQEDNQVMLTFQNYESGFDYSGVFDFIPRDRIKSISATGSVLTLTLDCACDVSAFLEKDAFIVLDVGSPGQQLFGPLIEQNAPASTAGALAAEPTNHLKMNETALIPTRLSPLPGEPEKLTPQAENLLNSVQQRLIDEFNSPASQQVLKQSELINDSIIESWTKRDTLSDPEAPELDLVDVSDSNINQTYSNMRISSSYDYPKNSHPGQSYINIEGVTCPPAGDFDISTWGNLQSFDYQISQTRQGLFDERDNLNHNTAIKLAKQYLYFGFGVEAREVLMLDAGLALKEVQLLEISEILEGDHISSTSTLPQLANCDSDISLWAILASSNNINIENIEMDAALRTLNKLPIVLRNTLAPELSEKFLSMGSPDAAADALRSVERLPGSLPTAVKFAKAQVNLDRGQVEIGTTQLIEAIEENTEQSPNALISFIDAQLQAGLPIDKEKADLVEAYAKELEDTELGPELRRVHILALIKSKEFDRAFEASAELGGDENTTEAISLRREILRQLISTASDIVFLDHIFVQTDQGIEQLSPIDRRNLARRFLDLGFAVRAEAILENVPLQSRDDDYKLLAAGTSLALRKPFKAQAEILGLTSEAAELLRAKAKQMAGDNVEAHDLYVQLGRPQEAADTAWLANDWRSLTPPETATVFGRVSSLSSGRNDVTSTSEGMLRRSTSLLQESVNARQVLTDLLNADSLSVTTEN